MKRQIFGDDFGQTCALILTVCFIVDRLTIVLDVLSPFLTWSTYPDGSDAYDDDDQDGRHDDSGDDDDDDDDGDDDHNE